MVFNQNTHVTNVYSISFIANFFYNGNFFFASTISDTETNATFMSLMLLSLSFFGKRSLHLIY